MRTLIGSQQRRDVSGWLMGYRTGSLRMTLKFNTRKMVGKRRTMKTDFFQLKPFLTFVFFSHRVTVPMLVHYICFITITLSLLTFHYMWYIWGVAEFSPFLLNMCWTNCYAENPHFLHIILLEYYIFYSIIPSIRWKAIINPFRGFREWLQQNLYCLKSVLKLAILTCLVIYSS